MKNKNNYAMHIFLVHLESVKCNNKLFSLDRNNMHTKPDTSSQTPTTLPPIYMCDKTWYISLFETYF